MLGNKQGGLLDLPVILFIGFFVLILLVSLIPALVEIFNMAKQSDGLNCVGYKYGGNATASLSYNSSLSTNTIGCTAVGIAPGLLVLGVIMAVLLAVFYGRAQGGQDQYPGQM